jgi:6-phosphogluconolactonase
VTAPGTPPRIEVHESADALATAIAGELLLRLADAQSSGHDPQIALTGGTIADAVHHELARLAPSAEVDWARVVVWWGDERFVAADSPDRNDGQAMAAFGGRLPFDPAHVHVMPSTGDAASVDEAAAAYSATVRSEGAGFFEVLMLGVGPDGHVASLFPGSSQLDATDAIAVGVTDSPKPPPERVTLTYEAMDRCRSVWFLVSGAEKADAVARALAGGTDKHEIPAVGVTGELETIWFLDRASASAL